jgi:thiol-disulfide isomerase/thioredoxin
MKANLWILLCILPFGLMGTPDSGVFHQGGFLAAKELAEKEGKLQLIEFYAEWCTPCKHMEQTTFKDEALLTYLKGNFVNVKVDIDQFDGFALKEEYSIRYLPTILLLDTDGSVVGKIEEALGPQLLMERLDQISQTRQSGNSNVNEEPSIPQHTKVNDSVILQFGVFSSKENAEILFNKIAQVLPSDPEIKKTHVDGKMLFKVQYGPFSEISEAEMLKEELQLLGYQSYIKPLE